MSEPIIGGDKPAPTITHEEIQTLIGHYEAVIDDVADLAPAVASVLQTNLKTLKKMRERLAVREYEGALK